MGKQVYQELTWEGVTVDTYTDTTTGRIQVFSKGFAPLGGLGGVLIAESVPGNGKSDWRLVDGARYRRSINRQRDRDGEIPYTEKQFNKQFFSGGARQFNNERAFVLNKPGNSSQSERQAFFDNRVPFTSNPTGKKERVNFDQSITSTQVVNQNANPDPDVDVTATVPLNAPLGDGGGGGGGDGAGQNLGTNPDNGSTGQDGSIPNASTNGPIGQIVGDDQEEGLHIITVGEPEDPNKFAYDGTTLTGGNQGELIKYPLIDPPPGLNYDYVTFTAYEYNPGGVSLARKEYVHSGTQYETIQLPIQPTITETNSVGWTQDQLNDIQKGFADLSKGGMDFFDGDGGVAFKQAFQNGKEAIEDLLNNPTTKPLIKAFFAGQAVQANIIGRSTGAIINPNLELLFNGPALRTFNFNFRLTPRNADESRAIRKLIRAFKRNSAVQRTNPNLFLISPRVFQIEYNYRGQGQHPYLNKFKPTALTNFSVNYTPDGSYMVFGSTGSLTAYDITMSFTEINPIYADDIGDSDTDMGF